MNILVSGLYYSGSSALVDMLSEYNNITVVENEFDDIRRAGMLGDYAEKIINDKNPSNIEYASNSFWYPVKINLTYKYLIKQLIKKIIFDSPLCKIYKNGLYKNRKKRATLLVEAEKKLISLDTTTERIEVLKRYIQDVSSLYKKENHDKVLFDQAIFYNSHIETWPKIFDPYKLLVVYRDPRDQIADLVKRDLIFFDIETPTRSLIEIYGNTRFGAIKYETDTLNARYKNAKKLQDKLGKDKVLMIEFEKLVLDYENVKDLIENFLELKKIQHSKKREFFEPNNSAKNIGIYKEILSEEEIEYINKNSILINKEKIK